MMMIIIIYDARAPLRILAEFGGTCQNLSGALSVQYTNFSEGADIIGGQLRGDKECPFSGVISSRRVWRKVPESDEY